jgi:mRNA interferase MazF
LKIASKVRVARMVTLERRYIVRRIGKLAEEQIQQLNTSLIRTFQL